MEVQSVQSRRGTSAGCEKFCWRKKKEGEVVGCRQVVGNEVSRAEAEQDVVAIAPSRSGVKRL